MFHLIISICFFNDYLRKRILSPVNSIWFRQFANKLNIIYFNVIKLKFIYRIFITKSVRWRGKKTFDSLKLTAFIYRHWNDDLVPISLWIVDREIWWWCAPAFESCSQSSDLFCQSIDKKKARIMFKQGYSWLKDKILNEEGRKQQSKIRELAVLAAKFDCTLAQLAIGMLFLISFSTSLLSPPTNSLCSSVLSYSWSL